MSYQSKYLKYKTKYLELKKQLGGTEFNDLTYLNSGAENSAFKMPDGKILRVRKGCNRLEDDEKTVMLKIIEHKPKYFAMIYSVGKCADLKGKKLELAKSMCAVSEGVLCDYDYVIMEEAPGTTFLIFSLQQFKDLVMNSDFDTEIEKADTKDKIRQFAKNSAEYLIKIIDGLMDANTKFVNYKHNDLNHRNCHTDEFFVPTIFDYGASKISAIPSQDQCSDAFNYIKNMLNDSELDVVFYNGAMPEWRTLNLEMRKKVVKNFRTVRRQFRQYEVFNKLCSDYYTIYEDDEAELGLKFDIVVNKVKTNRLTLQALKTL